MPMLGLIDGTLQEQARSYSLSRKEFTRRSNRLGDQPNMESVGRTYI